jgi:hypothetical protein
MTGRRAYDVGAHADRLVEFYDGSVKEAWRRARNARYSKLIGPRDWRELMEWTSLERELRRRMVGELKGVTDRGEG